MTNSPLAGKEFILDMFHKSENPDGMPQNVAHQSLHCLLLKTKMILRERKTILAVT